MVWKLTHINTYIQEVPDESSRLAKSTSVNAMAADCVVVNGDPRCAIPKIQMKWSGSTFLLKTCVYSIYQKSQTKMFLI